ncbi:zinc ribbon domain-containing protein [Okeania sp. KiyG1]|uniref:zinc ribbon domain-containing protein n=1 Tax=Okeania sp. KiyG1 TaxID=2720165 RepID=UPI0035C94155
MLKLLAQLRPRRQMLEVKTIVVNPQKQSQNCSNCGEGVPKKLPERTHYCANCCVIIDHDLFAEHDKRKCSNKY